MEEQKLFVDYLAYISDADDLSKELDWTFKIIKDNYNGIDSHVFTRILVENLNEAIAVKESDLKLANHLGTISMSYSFPFEGKRIERDLAKVIKTWKYAVIYIEELVKMPTAPRLLLKFDELPDFMDYDQMYELTGWKKKSVQTKHSNLELACVKGTGLTTKQGLLDYFTKRIIGVQEDPEKWFNEEIIKKKNKQK